MAEVPAGGHATPSSLPLGPGGSGRDSRESGHVTRRLTLCPAPAMLLRTLHPGVPGLLSLVPELAALETFGGGHQEQIGVDTGR